MNALQHKIASTLAEEHGAVRATMRAIELELARPRSHPAEVERVRDLMEEIRAFRHCLQRHFRPEQAGDLLSVMGVVDAATIRLAEQILVQHESIEGRLLGILSELGQLGEAGCALTERSKQEIRSLFAQLARHEHLENDLYRRVVEPGPTPES